MGVLDRLLRRGRSQGKDNRDGFEPTEAEFGMINEFMPLDRGGLLAFEERIKEAGVPEDRWEGLRKFFAVEKQKILADQGRQERRV